MSLANIPSRTLIWTPEYPLVTFLTPLRTLDILAAGSGVYHACVMWEPGELRQGDGSLVSMRIRGSGLDRLRREWWCRRQASEVVAQCRDTVQQTVIIQLIELSSPAVERRQESASLRTTSESESAACDNGEVGKGVGRRCSSTSARKVGGRCD